MSSDTQSASLTPSAHPPEVHDTNSETVKTGRYVARVLQQHLIEDAHRQFWTSHGSAVFVDISGFTKLSERLARKGREGAEQISDAIGHSFESILEVAYDHGGSLLKFGGDALLLWFAAEDHVARACRAALQMRRVLRDVGRIDVPGAKVTLRMAQAVHSGEFHFFAVGTSHLELLPTGPGWSRLVAMEQAADAGEILLSADTATLLPVRCLGRRKGSGVLLQRTPPGRTEKVPLRPRPAMPYEMIAHCLSPPIRAHVLGGGTSEHRAVTIAFIRYESTDALIGRSGSQAAAEALQRLVNVVAAAAAEQEVTFLGSDVDADGGKLILTAGAPKVIGDDEERMLLALRRIVETDLSIPIRIGVHRGSVFAGDIGPFFRRTYTVMGDAVNLAARLMAEAPPGSVYATADVLDHSNTVFETTELAPLAVRGKVKPVPAWAVGRAKGSRSRHVTIKQLPLIGRDAELAVLRDALAAARAGNGRLIEIVGEAGVGKTRLLQALEADATGLRVQHAVCEAYTISTPYAVWTELLREFMEFGRDDPDTVIEARLREALAARAGELTPWLPLIAIAFGLEIAPTPEVQMLAENYLRAKIHEVVGQFLAVLMPDPTLIEIENAQHMDAASADLLKYLCGQLNSRPWLFAVARREAGSRFKAPESAAVLKLRLEPLAVSDALRLTQFATVDDPLPRHVLDVIAQRSGGNPQFLRDLLRSAIESGGIADLPDSAEAAAMARIDALEPEHRALVRRAAVFGLTFHPRMLSWFDDDSDTPPPGQATWERLHELFDEEPDGYLRFRRSLLREAAYEGLPYKLRRQLHRTVAVRMEGEMDQPEEAADILSLHYLVAGEHGPAWRYASVAARRAEGAFAYVEAAGLYARAVDAGRRVTEVANEDIATIYAAQAECWYRAAEFEKAADRFAAAYRLRKGNPVEEAKLLLRRSRVEEKLGKYRQALRWATRARKAVNGLDDREAARQAAQATTLYAQVLQYEGRQHDALRWARRGVIAAEAADAPNALGEAYHVMGWAIGVLGREGARQLYDRSLQAYQRSGNLVSKAAVLSNLGVVCQWEGCWDEALSYYERSRDESLKIGSTANAAVSRINIAEILIDRGELAEAEEILQETLPLWKASRHRYFLGVCLSLLGRASLRAGRHDEALKRLEEARAIFVQVGAEDEVPPVDARIAECRVCMGETNAALALVDGLLSRAGSSNAVARLAPLLKRVRAHALLQRGDLAGVRRELEASLAEGRVRKDLLEIALTLLSLIELHHLEGVEPPVALVTESNSLVETLKIRNVPHLPVAAP
jgi:class 3 adenylate cyclase/tetratricopeptide (TPR) repeat protein